MSVLADFAQLFTGHLASPALSIADEHQLLHAAHLGDSAATEQLLIAYSPIMRNSVSAALRASGKGSDATEDLQSAAVEGALLAIKAWDSSRHDRLAAVIRPYVRDAVSSAMNSTSEFAVPDRTAKRFWGIMKRAGYDVNVATELATEHEMSVEAFYSVLTAVRNTYSLEGMFESDEQPEQEGLVADLDDKLMADAALKAIDADEHLVVHMAYGFDEDPVPVVEIAHRIGSSRNRVSRTRDRALEKMRERLGVDAESEAVQA